MQKKIIKTLAGLLEQIARPSGLRGIETSQIGFKNATRPTPKAGSKSGRDKNVHPKTLPAEPNFDCAPLVDELLETLGIDPTAPTCAAASAQREAMIERLLKAAETQQPGARGMFAPQSAPHRKIAPK